MVLTELLQNAVEHGYDADDEAPAGAIVVTRAPAGGPAARQRRRRRARAARRASTSTASTSLGLSIVRTLVESELGGQLELGAAPSGRGPGAAVDVPLD